MEVLNKVFKVRRGEGEKVFLMFLYSFFAVSAFIIGRIIAGTLFLHRSGIKNLPYLYLLVAVVVAVITWFYNRFSIRFRLDRAILGVTFLLAVAVFALWFALTIKLAWAPAVFYVFAEVMGGLLIIQFGTFLNELFNAREVKRLGGLIWAGGVTANLVSFPMRGLTKYIPAENFLLIIIVALIACMIIVYHLAKQNKGLLEYAHSTRHLLKAKHSVVKKAVIGKEDATSGFEKFITLKWYISAIVAVSILTVTLVDYQFKVVAKMSFADEAQLADFFFTVYAYSGVLAIILQVFLVGRIMERFGIKTSLFVLPISVLLSAVGVVGLKKVFAVWVQKASDLVLRYTLCDPTIKLLYQPLPPSLRRRAQAVDGGIVRPIAQGAGGLLALIVSIFIPMQGIHNAYALSWIVIALIGVWSFIILRVYNGYVQALLVARPQRIRDARTEVWDDIPQDVINRALLSREEEQVLNALEIVLASGRGDWYQTVYSLLKEYNSTNLREATHVLSNPLARKRALAYLARSGNRAFAAEILKLFSDEDEEVIAEAIQAYCSIEHERAVPAISAFLAHPAPKVKAASITGLIKYGGLDGILHSVAELKKMIESPNSQQRMNAAEVLGLIKIQSFYQSLFKLILDKNQDVQRKAIVAAGELGSLELLPQVIYMLRQQHTHKAAVKALTKFCEQGGNKVINKLIGILKEPYMHMQIRIGIVSVLQELKTQQAADALVELLVIETSDKLLQAIVQALSSIRLKQADVHIDVRTVREVLHAEVERYYQYLLDEQLAKTYVPSTLLLNAIRDKQNSCMKRIFGLLSLLYPPRLVEIVAHDVISENKRARANAMEIIDNVFDSETRSYLLPALDTIPLAEKIERGEKFFRLKRRDRFEFVEYLLETDDTWLATTTLHAIATNQLREFVPHIKFFLDHEDALLRETAIFALKTLAPQTLRSAINKLYYDEDTVVSAYAMATAKTL